MRTSIIACFFMFVSVVVLGQATSSAMATVDTVLLNNGKILAVQVIDTIGENVTVVKANSRKHKKIEIEKEAIFSIRFASTGKEEIYYIYDTLTEHDYSVPDARKFIEGEQDAQHGYHAVGASLASFLIGFTAGAYFGDIISLGPPFLFSGVMTYPRIKVRHKSVRNKANGTSDPYLYGYDSTARRKRTLHSFLWGGLGVILGIIANPIILNNTN